MILRHSCAGGGAAGVGGGVAGGSGANDKELERGSEGKVYRRRHREREKEGGRPRGREHRWGIVRYM